MIKNEFSLSISRTYLISSWWLAIRQANNLFKHMLHKLPTYITSKLFTTPFYIYPEFDKVFQSRWNIDLTKETSIDQTIF